MAHLVNDRPHSMLCVIPPPSISHLKTVSEVLPKIYLKQFDVARVNVCSVVSKVQVSLN